MIDFCILGSGIAGSTIAKLLSKKYSVHVFDKARGLGGRSSNKRFKNNLSFDHGVQYISPKSKEFKILIKKLIKKKIIKRWNGDHIDLTLEKKSPSSKYIGVKGNNDFSKYHLKGIKLSLFSEIVKINFKKNYWEISLKDRSKHRFKSIILTCPYPQLKKIAKNYLSEKLMKLEILMQPNITFMIALKNNKNLPISSIKFDDETIAWVANENSKRRFKSNLNLWTIQSTLKFSKRYINSYKEKNNIVNLIEKKFLKITNLNKKNVVFKKIHGWKYSYNYKRTVLKSFWNKRFNFGICADWFNGPKVEDAWISSIDLYKKIKKNPLN